jgi:hypothetical protein
MWAYLSWFYSEAALISFGFSTTGIQSSRDINLSYVRLVYYVEIQNNLTSLIHESPRQVIPSCYDIFSMINISVYVKCTFYISQKVHIWHIPLIKFHIHY